uniref:RING-type domain-containing protein n=1 Tax=Lygus hesperus TaxID=30085 RepID=A0A0B8RVB3_LYGHE
MASQRDNYKTATVEELSLGLNELHIEHHDYESDGTCEGSTSYAGDRMSHDEFLVGMNSGNGENAVDCGECNDLDDSHGENYSDGGLSDGSSGGYDDYRDYIDHEEDANDDYRDHIDLEEDANNDYRDYNDRTSYLSDFERDIFGSPLPSLRFASAINGVARLKTDRTAAKPSASREGKKRNSVKDILLCVVCLNESREYAPSSCHHLCLCKSCADLLLLESPKCPMCRKNFTALIRIYL